MTSAHKKIFAALFLSIFCSVTGVGIVVPLLPVYASKMGSTGIYIGLVFGAFSLSRTAFFTLFWQAVRYSGSQTLYRFWPFCIRPGFRRIYSVYLG